MVSRCSQGCRIGVALMIRMARDSRSDCHTVSQSGKAIGLGETGLDVWCVGSCKGTKPDLSALQIVPRNWTHACRVEVSGRRGVKSNDRWSWTGRIKWMDRIQQMMAFDQAPRDLGVADQLRLERNSLPFLEFEDHKCSRRWRDCHAEMPADAQILQKD